MLAGFIPSKRGASVDFTSNSRYRRYIMSANYQPSVWKMWKLFSFSLIHCLVTGMFLPYCCVKNDFNSQGFDETLTFTNFMKDQNTYWQRLFNAYFKEQFSVNIVCNFDEWLNLVTLADRIDYSVIKYLLFNICFCELQNYISFLFMLSNWLWKNSWYYPVLILTGHTPPLEGYIGQGNPQWLVTLRGNNPDCTFLITRIVELERVG